MNLTLPLQSAVTIADRHGTHTNKVLGNCDGRLHSLIGGESGAVSAAMTTLNIMTCAKLQLAIGISAAIILVGGTPTVVLSSDLAGDHLSPGDILRRAQQKYASLTSYSDDGKTVATLNGTTLTTAFTIRLARPNLYRIDWEQPVHSSYTNKGAVWSAGEGDFLRMGSSVTKRASQMLALGSATGISGGSAASIPGTFFKLNWGDQLGGPVSSEKQQPDQKVGAVDCYVLTSDSKGRTRTLWIGKEDFMIHQVRNVTSAEAMKALLAEVAKRQSDTAAGLPEYKSQGVTSTETHENIVVDQKFLDEDFVPQVAGER